MIIKLEPDMKMTISITKEEKKIFNDLCEEETHGPSDQFRHILKFYLKHKDKVK